MKEGQFPMGTFRSLMIERGIGRAVLTKDEWEGIMDDWEKGWELAPLADRLAEELQRREA